MSNPIGHTFMYNIIILFILIVFAFLMGTLSYYKGYKINNRIVGSIEKFEGYNELTIEEINRTLGTFGYQRGYRGCAERYKDMYLTEAGTEEYKYCIYTSYDPTDRSDYPQTGEFYRYGVLTFMRIDLPIVDYIEIPIFTRTNRIYKFSDVVY